MASHFYRLDSVRRMLRVTYGLVPIVAGLDKFFNILTNWTQYLNPAITQMFPITPVNFMQMVGLVEIVAGLLVLSRFTAFGAYLVSLWLTLIAVTLIASGRYLDVAVRDLAMAVGAYTLGSLTRAKRAEETLATTETKAYRPAA